MTLAVGSILGAYQLEALLGSGGFSTVWQARDHRFDTTVALKILAENHALNPDVRTRFIDEARMIRKVRSHHVVAVHDLGETPSGQPFLVLDLAERGDLQARITARAPGGVPMSDALEIAMFLTEALADVHSAGLVHRDVKPGNVLIARQVRSQPQRCSLVDEDERFILADLGFAKDLSLASGYTSGGGTRWFQAPEQLPAVARVDHRADVYSASALLAWLLTGSVPNPTSSWVEHLAERGVDHNLAAGLSEDPEKRPASMQHWLASVIAGHSAAEPDQRHPSRRGFLIGAVAATVVAGAGVGGGWLLGRSDGSRAETETSISDGVVTIAHTTPSGPIMVVGPATMKVNEQALYTATGPAGVALTWVQPDGTRLDATRPLQLIASSTGIAVINLQAVVQGRLEVLSHDIVVAES